MTGVLTNYDIDNYFDKNYQQFQKFLLRMYNYVNFNPVLDCTVILETREDSKVNIFSEKKFILYLNEKICARYFNFSYFD